MMKQRKTMILVVLALAIMIGVTVPVLAQSPPGLPDWLAQLQFPDSAAGGMQQIALWLAALAGLAATAIVDTIKGLPWLTDGERSKIAGPTGNLVAAIISVLSGYVIGYLGVAAGLMDKSGLWQVLLFTWPLAKSWFEAQKFTRA